MNIVIPDGLIAWIEKRASQAGFTTPGEYVLRVFLDAEQDRGRDGEYEQVLREAMAEGRMPPLSIPQEAVDHRKREIEALLLEGIECGPAAPMTAEDWESIREEVRERRERRKHS